MSTEPWEDLYNHMRQHHPGAFRAAVEVGETVNELRRSLPPECHDALHTKAAAVEMRVMELLRSALEMK